MDISPRILTLQPSWWQTCGDTGRRPTANQWWSLNPQLSIVTLQTDEGGYELAALPSHLAELRERLFEAAPA